MSVNGTIENEVNDRFTLYPTKSIYTFILLDQLDGRTWQVQYMEEPSFTKIDLVRSILDL